MLLNACDPANPFGFLFPVTTETGEKVKFRRIMGSYLVLRAGQPVLLCRHGVTLLADLTREEAEAAIGTLLQKGETSVPYWNGHPIDVSPARHLLTKLGFVKGRTRWEGFVHDGTRMPDEGAMAAAEKEAPELYERHGKEEAPVRYDAEWVVSRSHAKIRSKVRELLGFLGNILPEECELVYHPRGFRVLYRGVRCINPLIQQKQVWLQIAHKGWTRGILISPDTDLSAPEFAAKVMQRFEKTRLEIDSLLDIK